MILFELRQAVRRVMIDGSAWSAIAIATLTIGLAVGTAIVVIADAILLRSHPYARNERLVAVWATAADRGLDRFELNYPDLKALEGEGKPLARVAAYAAANSRAIFWTDGRPLDFHVNIVSAPLYPMLGARPAAGRLFEQEDALPESEQSALLSHSAWVRHFGGDPSVIGTGLQVGDETVRIIGVLPQTLDFPQGAEIVTLLERSNPALLESRQRVLAGVGLVAPGLTLDEAHVSVSVIAAQLAKQQDETTGLELEPLSEHLMGRLAPVLRMMLAMGLLVSLISWLNVGGLFLTQVVAREKEFAMRMALGATPWRASLTLTAEALILAAIAAPLGLALAEILLAFLLRLAPGDLPSMGDVALQAPALLFLFTNIAVGVVLAAIPASLRLSRIAVSSVISDSGARMSESGQTKRATAVVTALQVTLACLLALVAGLFQFRFLELQRVDPGFDRAGVITAHIPFPYSMRPEPGRVREFFASALAEIRRVPGVVAAGSSLMRPMELQQGWDYSFVVEGQTREVQRRNPFANWLVVTPGYHEALGTRLLAGRAFQDSDRHDSPAVAIVGESFARRYWGSPGNAIGRRIKEVDGDSERRWQTVVGVVSDLRQRGITVQMLDVYQPYTQTNWSPNYLAIRIAPGSDTGRVMSDVRGILTSMRPDAVLVGESTTAALLDRELAQPRFNAAIAIVFAAAALLISLSGVYSALSYWVSRRSNEFGIRLSMGATPPDLLRLILRETMVIALPGILLTAGIALFSLRLRWVNVSEGAWSPVLAAAILIVPAACMVAAVLPALRVLRMTPSHAIREGVE
ncbi:MAG TPA: ABC transporter permease [Thermoanaerobaculia bacterium]